MAETLYRKYRPQIFADVAEQEHVLRTITQQLATNSIAHAYLFSGPRGVGKTTIARLLAKALNCENRAEGQAEPCTTCVACLDFAAGRFLSCIEIDAASQTGVDNVRENIIENARFAPTRGKYKVFILDEVHMLSSASFNALLKTLEEPPAHAVFILATTELHKIPATIVSRCQRFEFHRVPPVVMMPRLAKIAEHEGIVVDEGVLAQIARLSEGCLRDAESLLGQVLALDNAHVTLEIAALVLPMTNLALIVDMVDDLGKGNVKQAIDRLGAFVGDGGSVKHLAEEMIEYIRTVMFVALGDQSNDAYDDKTMERIRGAASVFGALQSRQLLDALLDARLRQSLPTFPQIPLEIALLSMSGGVAVQMTQPLSPPQKTMPSVAVTPPAPRYDFTPAPAAPLEQVRSTEAPLFSLDELKDKWERCCTYVAEKNIALPLILRSAKPGDIQGSSVTIHCAYAFHADALKEVKARALVEEAIEHVLQKKVTITAVHVPIKGNIDAVESFVSELGGSLE